MSCRDPGPSRATITSDSAHGKETPPRHAAHRLVARRHNFLSFTACGRRDSAWLERDYVHHACVSGRRCFSARSFGPYSFLWLYCALSLRISARGTVAVRAAWLSCARNLHNALSSVMAQDRRFRFAYWPRRRRIGR